MNACKFVGYIKGQIKNTASELRKLESRVFRLSLDMLG